jgi:hypothetical protein
MAVTGYLTRSMFDRYNIVSEDDLRMAAQKTTMYVDTLPVKRVAGQSLRAQRGGLRPPLTCPRSPFLDRSGLPD